MGVAVGKNMKNPTTMEKKKGKEKETVNGKKQGKWVSG